MKASTTLKQGLEEFRKKNGALFSERPISEEGQAFLQCHDIAHVLFGCDTSIYGEGVVKIWTTFGTSLSFWKIVSGYNEASAFGLFRMYSFSHVTKNILRYLRVIPAVIFRAKAMTKPWPFSDYAPYLNRPISDIRDEFNIRVLEK